MLKNRIKERREVLNLKQSELAEIIGVSPSTIGMYEQGRRDPDSATLKLLVSALKTSADYLLGIVNQNDENILKKYGNEDRELLDLAHKSQISLEDIKYLISIKKEFKTMPEIDNMKKFIYLFNNTFKEYLNIFDNKSENEGYSESIDNNAVISELKKEGISIDELMVYIKHLKEIKNTIKDEL
jgi:transcriptional regulator with XRE-family HTH domain